jgi:hypothetical protein
MPDVRMAEAVLGARAMSASRFSSHMKSLERLLCRQTAKDGPESRLVVAVLARAILDLAIPSQRRNAQRFIASSRLEDWCGFVGLEPLFVREMAKRWISSRRSKKDKERL